jgi:exosome complex component MTR3
MTDRRRNNGPAGGTKPPLFDFAFDSSITPPQRPGRTRSPTGIRSICKTTISAIRSNLTILVLKTGLVPPASGSAYLELESPASTTHANLFRTPTLKLSATVHGPRPLPRSAAFAPHLALTCTLKFAPYASRKRRTYLRDSSERDLGAMLEQALRGIIVGERFPKTGVDVVVTVIEGEEDDWWGSDSGGRGWGSLSVLSGAVTAASAALVDAGIDVLDVVVGGVAAYTDEEIGVILDPNPVEHANIRAACTVGYIAGRDEIPLIWMKGAASGKETELLIDSAVKAAIGAKKVVDQSIREGLRLKIGRSATV